MVFDVSSTRLSSQRQKVICCYMYLSRELLRAWIVEYYTFTPLSLPLSLFLIVCLSACVSLSLFLSCLSCSHAQFVSIESVVIVIQMVLIH